MSHDFVWAQSVTETFCHAGLFSSAKCRDRLWVIAKFQMRHRLRPIPGLQLSWHNIIYDALAVRVLYIA